MATREDELVRLINSMESAFAAGSGRHFTDERNEEDRQLLARAKEELAQVRGEGPSTTTPREPVEPRTEPRTTTERSSSGFNDLFPAREEGEGEPMQMGPFDDLFMRGGLRPSDWAITRTTGLERFSEGVGKGFVHPVKGFLPDMEEAEGLAGMFGEFVGAGISFVPLFKGAQLVAKGIGLTRSASLLGAQTTFLRGARTAAGVRGARTVEGALAFAGFETFSGDIEGAPGRFAMGLVEGLAFEAAAIKAAALWRAKHPRWTYQPVGRTRAEIQEANIHPYALKMERWFAKAGESFNQTAAKLKAIEAGEQLDQAFQRIKNTFMPGASAVLPEVHIDDVGSVVGAARRSGLETSVFRQADDTFEIFIVDPSKDVLKRTANVQRQAKPTRQDLVDALKQDYDDIGVAFLPEDWSDGTLGEFMRWGVHRFDDPPEDLIKILEQNPEENTLETLFHEIMHKISWHRAAENLGHDTGSRPTLLHIFDFEGKPGTVKFTETITEFRDGLKALVLKSVQNQSMRIDGLDAKAALKKAKERIKRDPGYFHNDDELLAWSAGYMFTNFDDAMRTAPKAVERIAQLIAKDAPATREMLTRQSQAIFDRLRSMWVEHLGRTGDDALTVFQKGKPEFGASARKTFEKSGFAPGMRVIVNGRPAEFVKNQGALGVIRFLDTGKTAFKQKHRIQKPLISDIVEREKAITRAVDDMLERKARNEIDDVAVNLLDEETGDVRRATVNTRNMDKAKSEREWRNSWTDEERALAGEALDETDQAFVDGGIPEDLIRAWRVMEARGVQGVLMNDEGFMEVLLGRFQNSLNVSGVAEGQAFGRNIAGNFRTASTGRDMADYRLTPDIDDQIRLWLRGEGVPEEDLQYFFEQARQRMGQRLDDLMDTEAQQIKENGAVAASLMDDDLEAMAARAQFTVKRHTDDGVVELRDSSSDAIIGRFDSEEAAQTYIAKSGPAEDAVDIVTTPNEAGAGGGGNPPKFQEQVPQGPEDLPFRELGKGGGLVDATTMFGSLWTSMENFARTAERKGFGPVYTKVFLPTQRAILEVDRQLAEVKRAALGDRSISDYMTEVAGHLNQVKKDRQQTVTRWIESMSKEEIAAPGGLLVRGMNENEVRVAKMIDAMGLGEDVPRLMATNRLIESALKSEEALLRQIDDMRRVRGTPERDALLNYFENLPSFKNFDEAAQALGLDQNELRVLDIIKKSHAASKDEFSIFAVSRYASAKPLGKGFKNGREEFAVRNNMTKHELAAGKKIDKMMSWAFAESNMDSKRQLGGYWPHMRMWAQHGYSPKNVPGLSDDMVEWSHAKFRSGELDVYNMDPLQTTYKYVRSLMMNKHFDPLLPGIKKALDGVKRTSPRVKDVMDEYVHELQGRPHASFRKLQGAVEEGWKAMTGKLPGENLVRNIINGVSALAAAAAIPFRPALIFRNYYESMQKIAPRTGFSYYARALKFVTNSKTKKQAWEMAKKAQAISPGLQRIKSIHASTELFGPQAGRAAHKMEQIFGKGFDWYQSADDWGRAIAYHAQRMRILDHYGAYVKAGGGRGKHLEKFLEDSKILTFDPVDVRIAEEQIVSGDIDAAIRHLGFTLARETMNRYGHANHPAGWNSIYGRLFGQFGTWPVQYKDYLAGGLTRGTAKDRAEFAAIHFGTMAGTLAGGSAVGLNLSSWIGFPSLTYTGGPGADLAIDVMKSISGSDAERALARRNLYSQIPILGWMETGRPNSIFLPGSYLLGDLQSAWEAEGITESILEGGGFAVLRPEQRSAFDWLMSGF